MWNPAGQCQGVLFAAIKVFPLARKSGSQSISPAAVFNDWSIAPALICLLATSALHAVSLCMLFCSAYVIVSFIFAKTRPMIICEGWWTVRDCITTAEDEAYIAYLVPSKLIVLGGFTASLFWRQSCWWRHTAAVVFTFRGLRGLGVCILVCYNVSSLCGSKMWLYCFARDEWDVWGQPIIASLMIGP